MTEHARLSPSGADKWMRCPGAILAESTVPSRTSSYAEEGTCAHNLAAWALESEHHNCEAFLGRIDPETNIEITEDMCGYVQEYVDDVISMMGDDNLHVEVKVDFSKVVGVPDSFGTADAVIVGATTLQVHDLKFGRGVAVSAEENRQLMIYALGAIEMFDEFGIIEEVTLGIHMPRKDGYNSWVVSRQELDAFGEEVKVAAMKAIALFNQGPSALVEENLIPGEKQCRWCDFKANCVSQGETMMSVVTDFKSNVADANEFDSVVVNIESATASVGATIDLATAGKLMALTDWVDDWVKAVRLRVITELEAGNAVPGYKLVRGREGNRSWTNVDDAEKMLKSMRFKQDEMYNMKLVSPTVASKLLEKTKTSKQRLNRLKTVITRKEGAISVAPESDKRLAVVLPHATDDEFDSVEDDLIG